MDPESWGPTLKTFLCVCFFVYVILVDEGRKDPNTTISGQSLARKCADDGSTLIACLLAL